MRDCWDSEASLSASPGSLFIGTRTVSVVAMGTLLGVPRVLLGSCTGARSTLALLPKQESDAAESRNAVVLLGWGGFVQLGESPSHLYIVFFAMSSPAGLHPHLPVMAAVASPSFFAKNSASLRLFSGRSGQLLGR